MARLFDDASSEYLNNSSAVVSAYPFTVSCWIYPDASDDQVVFSIVSKTEAGRFHLVGLNTSDNAEVRTRNGGASTLGIATSGNTVTLDAWNHILGRFISATDRRVILNGDTEATNATNSTPSSLTDTAIGRFDGISPGNYFSGRIAEVCIWDVDISNSVEQAALLGVQPARIQSNNIVSYWPIWGDDDPEPDLFGSTDMTVNNSPAKAVHTEILPWIKVERKNPRSTTRGVCRSII